MTPRVEKSEVFKKGWNFANLTYFACCIMKKTLFSIMDERNSVFSLSFLWNYFLQRWAIWPQSALNFIEHLYICKHQYKYQRSNTWIEKQPLISESAVQKDFGTKVSGLQFHWRFIFYGRFWGFWSHFCELFFAEFVVT